MSRYKRIAGDLGNQVGVPLAKKLLKQCYDAGVNLCAPLFVLVSFCAASYCTAEAEDKVHCKCVQPCPAPAAALTTRRCMPTARPRRCVTLSL